MKTPAKNVYVLYSKLKRKLEGDRFEYYFSQIPPHLQSQVCQFHNWQDAQSSLIGKILLKTGLIRYYDMDENVLDSLQYTRYNKPVISHSAIDFNISHSGKFVICAIGANTRLGIDVERVRPIAVDDFIRQFSGQELMDIYRSDDQYSAFFSYWTRKEAVLKAEGQGSAVPLNQISFNKDGNEAEVFSQRWYLNELSVDSHYKGWLALDKRLGTNAIATEHVAVD